ncbi:FKBP-type peptidyl-prolyl cis-trans isomerase FklB [Roseimicrobium gellanilyticum]|uniref:Peptidyl-prolyl cis-trans isomerase n=1 Tax=Roseimicrobium gellanilyticum TaxID=748857 RepID=A0A366HTP3_9BACT|nr:FKBP-type peptidyl-prolyl cis-trans isomerase [Roseimicrobium gellanilyticum]RBP46284.1 FKBP-type peptidyl-prolyl cis-trans isomerase FklB [Roseimicrobium gellanilyticum]
MKRLCTLLAATAALASCSSPEPAKPAPTPAPPATEGPLSPGSTTAGYTTTASGLQYKVVQPGSGRRPTAASTVTVHYRGTLLNGTEFDSSYSRGVPATFPLNGVIPGWTEGLQLMQEGAQYEFVIPSHLAYGTRGAPPDIGPNETLRFVVALIRVE